MFGEEIVPPAVEKKEWEVLSAWPKCVSYFEGEFVVECYMAMFLMFRNHLGRLSEAVGTTETRCRDDCLRVKQILLVITPNTMVYFARGSEAFQALKVRLLQYTVLTLPNFKLPMILHTDASDVGIGATLSQKDEGVELRLVACRSRKLSSAEKNYPVHEKEMLALIDTWKSGDTIC